MVYFYVSGVVSKIQTKMIEVAQLNGSGKKVQRLKEAIEVTFQKFSTLFTELHAVIKRLMDYYHKPNTGFIFFCLHLPKFHF